MDGSRIKQKAKGKGHIQSRAGAASAKGGASRTAGMKGSAATQTERHRTFHGHASAMRTSAGC